MRILMLGNSFTYENDLPGRLAGMLGAQVAHHTRGGARLAEQLNPRTRLGARTLEALQAGGWDYVVLQEMSNGPITSPASFFSSVTRLCEQIRANGAVPVLYATWAYQRGGAKLRAFGMDYDQMYQQLHQAYAQAAQDTGALMADVGTRFYQMADQQELYAQDSYHPSEAGSRLASQVLAQTIQRGTEDV